MFGFPKPSASSRSAMASYSDAIIARWAAYSRLVINLATSRVLPPAYGNCSADGSSSSSGSMLAPFWSALTLSVFVVARAHQDLVVEFRTMRRV